MTTPSPRGTSRPAVPPSMERIPEELVDRFFDRELDEGSREKFFGMLRADLSRCAEVAKTQRLVSMLREPVESPDMTGAILDRMRRRRAFLPERLRRMVKAGRLAAAACVLIGLLGIALMQRYAPDALRLSPKAQPLSGVIQSGTTEFAGAVDQVEARVAEPMTGLGSNLVQGQRGPGPVGREEGRQRLVLALTPGKTSVKLLPPGGDAGLVVAGGSGNQARFVLQGGVCIDRGSSTAMAFGLTMPLRPGSDGCTEAWFEAPTIWPAFPPAAPGVGKDLIGSVDSRGR